MASTQIVESGRSRLRAPLVALAVGVIVLVGLSVGSAPAMAHDLPFMLGYSVTWSAAAWAIVYFGFARRSGLKAAVLYFLVLYASAVLSQLAVGEYLKAQAPSPLLG